MPEDVTTCPSCGHDSRDPEWCDNCGARLTSDTDERPTWLEPGASTTLSRDGHELRVEIERAVDTFASRRVMFGRVVEAPSDFEELARHIDRRVLVEEAEQDTKRAGRIPDDLDGLFRTPLARGSHSGHAVRAYEDTGALTLEDLVDQAGGELSYKQIKDTFLAVLDTVVEAHEAGYLILAIAPWTIRVEGEALKQSDEDFVLTDSIDSTEDPTLESELPDQETLARAIEAASEASEASEDGNEDDLEQHSDVPDTEEVAVPPTRDVAEPTSEQSKETELDAPDTVETDAPIGVVEESSAKEADEDNAAQATEEDDESTREDDDVETVFDAELPVGLDGTTLPSHDAVAGLSDEGAAEDQEKETLDLDREDGDVDDLWDEIEDDQELGDTGILSSNTFSPNPDSLTAFFEGIDEVFERGEEPYEVPVINGFSPPELLGRVRADVGDHCDVFVLGMLLYYLVAGRVPPASVYTRYTPAVPARNYRPGFPPGLQTVIGRATRPIPADRYQSVSALRDAFVDACSLMERRATNVGGPESPQSILAVDTHIGINKGKRNPTNQDSVFGKVSDDGHFALIVVADGVSTASYGSGDLASNFLTETASEVWADVLPAYLMDERIDEVEIIGRILEEANEKIVNYVNDHFVPFSGNPHEVMGTTALIAVVREGIVTLASLGDSRVYVQTTSGLEQITTDHNLWTLSILDGISADAALSMPHGDALARCLGTFIVEEGELTAIRPDADYFRFTLARGDTMLMTTDGLIDFAGANPFAAEENILAVMLSEPDAALACLELVLLANRGGGGDNIGVGIIHFV